MAIKRKQTKLQIVGRKYRRVERRVERLNQRIYSEFRSQTSWGKTPIPQPHVATVLSAKWCHYTGYAPKEKGERLLALLQKAEHILALRKMEYDNVLQPRRAKMAEKARQRQLARREEDKRTYLPACFGMYAPLSDRKPRNEEERALVFALNDSSKDQTAWLVYADWLDERDGPAQSEGSMYQDKQLGGYTDAQLAAKIRKHIAFQQAQTEQQFGG